MIVTTRPEYTLRIDSMALERCFLIADVLADRFGQPDTEFGLIGLAAKSRPLHIIDTLLLPDQTVAPTSVEQSGHGVLRLRHEIMRLSQQRGQPLLPHTFIHRHPAAVDWSTIDADFLCGVFLNQIATLHTYRRNHATSSADRLLCLCQREGCSQAKRAGCAGASRRAAVHVSFAFSLIFNRERDRRIYAACKEKCMVCAATRARLATVELRICGKERTAEVVSRELLQSLESEIRKRVIFSPQGLN